MAAPTETWMDLSIDQSKQVSTSGHSWGPSHTSLCVPTAALRTDAGFVPTSDWSCLAECQSVRGNLRIPYLGHGDETRHVDHDRRMNPEQDLANLLSGLLALFVCGSLPPICRAWHSFKDHLADSSHLHLLIH